MPIAIGMYEIIVGLIYLILWFIIVRWYAKKNSPQSNLLYIFFTFKVLGSMLFFLLYNYYYQGGDTYLYYKGALLFSNFFLDQPLTYLKLLFTPSSELITFVKPVCGACGFRGDTTAILMMKITSVFNLLALNTFLSTQILFSFFSFSGLWLLYRTAYHKIKSFRKLGWIILFIPSVLVWSGGILKETLITGFVGIIIYLLFQKRKKYRKELHKCAIVLVSLYILFELRMVMSFIFIISLLFYLLMLIIRRENEKIHTVVLVSIPLVIFLFILFEGFINNWSYYHWITDRIRDFHLWHTYLNNINTDSGYDFQKVEYSFTGLVKKIPMAINVALFRPYFWETNNWLMTFSSIQSFTLLLSTLLLIVKVRSKIFSLIYQQPYLVFSIVFSILTAIIVGIVAYNFGALSRYRIPLLPFYLIALISIYSSNKEEIKFK